MERLTTTLLMLVAVLAVQGVPSVFDDQAVADTEKVEMDCNPNLGHQRDVCPQDFCCVKDEFLPTYVYCRRISREGESCTTRPSPSECGCQPGFYCKPNIQSLTFQSFYGKCTNSFEATATSAVIVG